MPRTEAEYNQHRQEMAARSRVKSAQGRDIGSIPPIVDEDLRRACDESFRTFCEELYPERFSLAWSDDHLRVIRILELTAKAGGRSAIAMPRGSGKSALCEALAEWALLTGRHPYVFGIGAAEKATDEFMDNVKGDLSSNDRLLEVYPEVCYPIQMLEGESRRALGQLHHGRRTGIVWKDREIRLPFIPGSAASGAMLKTAGLTGNLRGARVRMPDGRIVRPTFAVVDDIQTEESAWSETQVEQRRRIVERAIGGLGGPGKTCAIALPCTVIRSGDVADQLLDRQTNPLWRGIRTKVIYDWPENEKLWEKYAELREHSLRSQLDIGLATEFYRDNREAMDKGARVAWAERYDRDEGEISALQHVYNLKLKDPAGFEAEYQNEPIDDSRTAAVELNADEIRSRLNGLNRRQAPTDAELVTLGIDVQGKALYWSLVAWSMRFDGWVIDYGAFPDQPREYFTLDQITKTLARNTPGAGQEGQIYAGLEQLVERFYETPIVREDGAELVPNLVAIDANWNTSTDLVYRYARASSRPIVPGRGRYYGASTRPLTERKLARGERGGPGWYIAKPGSRGAARPLVFDSNHWKSFIAERLLTQIGDRGALTLYGSDPGRHRMIAEQLTSETPIRTEANGRTVDEWKHFKKSRDNHLFDSTVLAAVAASAEGARITDLEQPRRGGRKKRSLTASIEKANSR